MQMTKEKQDLTYLSWSVYRNSSGDSRLFFESILRAWRKENLLQALEL